MRELKIVDITIKKVKKMKDLADKSVGACENTYHDVTSTTTKTI
jgi:hypothetical protein